MALGSFSLALFLYVFTYQCVLSPPAGRSVGEGGRGEGSCLISRGAFLAGAIAIMFPRQ